MSRKFVNINSIGDGEQPEPLRFHAHGGPQVNPNAKPRDGMYGDMAHQATKAIEVMGNVIDRLMQREMAADAARANAPDTMMAKRQFVEPVAADGNTYVGPHRSPLGEPTVPAVATLVQSSKPDFWDGVEAMGTVEPEAEVEQRQPMPVVAPPSRVVLAAKQSHKSTTTLVQRWKSGVEAWKGVVADFKDIKSVPRPTLIQQCAYVVSKDGRAPYVWFVVMVMVLLLVCVCVGIGSAVRRRRGLQGGAVAKPQLCGGSSSSSVRTASWLSISDLDGGEQYV